MRARFSPKLSDCTATAKKPLLCDAQEAVELALKGLLRSCGIEVPHVHDVGPVLKRHRSRLPSLTRSEADQLARISRRLARERSAAFYGEEESDASPHELYDTQDATEAVRDASWAVASCRAAMQGRAPSRQG
jgi:HEPN domain-containing protein